MEPVLPHDLLEELASIEGLSVDHRPQLTDVASQPRIVVEAVPGAGKTRLLLRLAALRPYATLFLAYNTQLAASVRAQSPDDILCLTFHALCGRCLGTVARDDLALEHAVARAERGELEVRDVPDVALVCIDEAQDVRPLYTRLVRVVGLVREDVAFVVAGDRNQLVYDFDPAFPATLDTLLHPQAAFADAGEWIRCTLGTTHRLPTAVAGFVNAMFGTRLETSREARRGSVEVRIPRTMFHLFEALEDVIVPAGPLSYGNDVLLLVDRRQGNRPLRTLLNRISQPSLTGRAGRVRIRMHGDSDESTAECGEEGSSSLTCGTFWGAKGLERDTVIVVLPEGAPRNPTYVATTRALRRMILVLDPRGIHAAAARAFTANPTLATLRANASGMQQIYSGCYDDAAVVRSFQKCDRFQGDASAFRDLSRVRTPANKVTTECAYRSSRQGDSTPPPEDAPMGDLLSLMIRIALEHAATGRVRAMEDVLCATRVDRDAVSTLISTGVTSRMVPVFSPDNELLAPDLRALADTAYRSFRTPLHVFHTALAIRSWNEYDYTMRQTVDVVGWESAFATCLERARTSLLAMFGTLNFVYDVPLLDATRGYVRAHAVTSETCLYFAWAPSSDDFAKAATHASLHATGTCHVIDLTTGDADRVRAASPVAA